MNQQEMRRVAQHAARGYLRGQGINPETATVDSAWSALDDLWRGDREFIASQWYIGASENQKQIFAREWRLWHKERRSWR